MEIEAENEDSAERIAKRKWNKQQIVLDYNDFREVEIVAISNKN